MTVEIRDYVPMPSKLPLEESHIVRAMTGVFIKPPVNIFSCQVDVKKVIEKARSNPQWKEANLTNPEITFYHNGPYIDTTNNAIGFVYYGSWIAIFIDPYASGWNPTAGNLYTNLADVSEIKQICALFCKVEKDHFRIMQTKLMVERKASFYYNEGYRSIQNEIAPVDYDALKETLTSLNATKLETLDEFIDIIERDNEEPGNWIIDCEDRCMLFICLNPGSSFSLAINANQISLSFSEKTRFPKEGFDEIWESAFERKMNDKVITLTKALSQSG